MEPAQIDLGRVRVSSEASRTIRLRNTGGSELLLQGVDSSCNCTGGFVPGRDPGQLSRVAPGRSVPFMVMLHVPPEPGAVSETLRIRSTDPAQPWVIVQLRAEAVTSP